jgi:Phage portal protein, SPP1 Gp6-like.
MLQNWLNIVPASDQSFTLMEVSTFQAEVAKAKIWYRGDSNELSQFFKQVQEYGSKTSFWESAPQYKNIRKIHSGLPAIIADTLAYLVSSDLDTIDVDSDFWEIIEEKIDFKNLVNNAIVDTLVCGDGAFKISVDTEVSPYPIVEFVGANNVEFEQSRGIITGVVFKTHYTVNNKHFVFNERYEKNRIISTLYDENGKEFPIDTIEQLKGIEPVSEFDGDYIMAVPLKFFVSKKFEGRGKSIFSGGRSDCFDALDEVISQWWDALRMGRVKQYIPESFIPRNPENGTFVNPDRFGNDYISIAPPMAEGVDNQKIEVVQPDIKYDAFFSSYTNALLMCLQGLVSPATLGIDVGKMSSAEAQREKKDVTGNTRNTITAALEKALPELIKAVLKTYDIMQNGKPGEYEISVSFGEYGAPDFDSRIETIGKASSYGIMSVETQVEELWGSSKDDEWKAAEVERIKSEKGVESLSEPIFSEV